MRRMKTSVPCSPTSRGWWEWSSSSQPWLSSQGSPILSGFSSVCHAFWCLCFTFTSELDPAQIADHPDAVGTRMQPYMRSNAASGEDARSCDGAEWGRTPMVRHTLLTAALHVFKVTVGSAVRKRDTTLRCEPFPRLSVMETLWRCSKRIGSRFWLLEHAVSAMLQPTSCRLTSVL